MNIKQKDTKWCCNYGRYFLLLSIIFRGYLSNNVEQTSRCWQYYSSREMFPLSTDK